MVDVILLSVVSGLVGLVLAALFLRSRGLSRHKDLLSAFATGALLGVVFLDLLPETINAVGNANQVSTSVLAGFLVFFLLERSFGWFHHHHGGEDEAKSKSQAALVITGDSLHNFFDGVAIALAFVAEPGTGVVVAIATLIHELPTEFADMTLLMQRGFSWQRALQVNMFSALCAVLGAILGWGAANQFTNVGLGLGLSAGFILYIAASDLVPTLHQPFGRPLLKDLRLLLLFVGIALIYLAGLPF